MGSKTLNRWVLAIGLLLLVIFFSRTILGLKRSSPSPLSLANVAQLVKKGQVSKITVQGDKLLVERTDGTKTSSLKEHEMGLVETLRNLGVTEEELGNVRIIVAPPSLWKKWLPILGALLPVLLFSVFIYMAFRQARGGANRALSFGKSQARMISENKPTVTFDDVAGVPEAKEDLKEVVDFLR
ncbi:MAG: cell division protein FtsH, partial [Chloroflexota bacterium]|nr:cell division protein FtsH [Chloroflexota bacterium]